MPDLAFDCVMDAAATVHVDFLKHTGVRITVLDVTEDDEPAVYLDAEDVATLAGYLSALVEQEWKFKDD